MTRFHSDHRQEAITQGVETIVSKEDFRKQSKTMQGSRDFGAQLFCALLRSVAVETRLVCSLQAIPFTGTVKGFNPVETSPKYIVISSDDHDGSSDDKSRSQTPATSTPPPRLRRIGQPQFTPSVRRPVHTVQRTSKFMCTPLSVLCAESEKPPYDVPKSPRIQSSGWKHSTRQFKNGYPLIPSSQRRLPSLPNLNLQPAIVTMP